MNKFSVGLLITVVIAVVTVMGLVAQGKIHVGGNQEEVAVSSDESSEDTSDSQEESDQRVAELEQQVEDLKNKQQEEDEQKKQEELHEYKGNVLEAVTGAYTMLTEDMMYLRTSSGLSVNVMDTYFEFVEVALKAGLPYPPAGGENVYQYGQDALKAMLDIKPTITLSNGQCFATQATEQKLKDIEEKVKKVSNTFVTQ